jgi:hypothetical protein
VTVERAPERPPDPASIVDIPQATLEDVIQVINRPQCLLADRIEVEATRIPFKPALVPVADPNFVETADVKDATGEANGFVMRSMVEEAWVERDCPRLRIGDGIDCMATREILVRYHTDVGQDRPVFLRIRAYGHAVYRDMDTGDRVERDALVLVAELVPGANGLILRHTIR